MALQFYPLKVKEVNRETKDAVSVSFEVPDNLRDVFDYKHGQYLTLKININGESQRRAYSISSSSLFGEPLTVTVKRATEGVVSNYINLNLEADDVIDVFPPLGNFTLDLNPLAKKFYVMFGGGSGITPLISLLKAILKTEPKSRVTFFYANHDENCIIYNGRLEELKAAYPENLNLIHILSNPGESWKGLKGRLNKEFIKKLIDEFVPNDYKTAEYLLCGPQGLMAEVRGVLDELNVPEHQVHKESFTAPMADVVEDIVQDSNGVKSPEPKTREITVKLYGETNKIEVEPDETILIAGIRQSLDPPFSCQIGACSTCRARLVSGKVHMDEREALTDEEIEEGFILTCQSHPLTDDVVVDYDDQ